jgi:hypothetical protein
MLNRIPCAPAMLTSSSGLAIASRRLEGAVLARRAADAHEGRAGVRMIVRTSAKSRLMRPGTVMMSLIPWTPWRSTSSTTRKASRIEVFFWTTSLRRSFGMVMRVSTLSLQLLGRLLGDRACGGRPRRERLGHDADRERALLRAISAMTGAAPEPVPPPRPAVMKTMSESGERLGDLLASSSAARWPIAVAPGAEARG